MKEIFFAIFKHSIFHWRTIVTCFADAIIEYGESIREEYPEGRKFYYDLGCKIFELRNEFEKREKQHDFKKHP